MRIDSVHSDLRYLIGILVPDYQQARALRDRQEPYYLDVLPEFDKRFEQAVGMGKLGFGPRELRLDDSTDIFVFHFDRSTKKFTPGMLLAERTPSQDQFLSLLKCIWVMRKIRNTPQLRLAHPSSHWPSYIKQLEAVGDRVHSLR
jgi:hypothetical protein